MEDSRLLADWIRAACRLEVLAPKPGNVSPDAEFDDLTVNDFLQSADVIAPILAETRTRGLGPAILDAVAATQSALGRNTNLGIILLLAPLAAVPVSQPLASGVGRVLNDTTVDDSRLVYRAIRLANPGGMGHSAEQDLADEPTLPLVDVMRLAAGRDTIAAMYATGFRTLLDFAIPTLLKWTHRCNARGEDIVALHLALMTELPDTLIARKCGVQIACRAAMRASEVFAAGWPDAEAGHGALEDFDRWLRADGHRRNPGTTADLVAATLFAALRDYGWSATQ